MHPYQPLVQFLMENKRIYIFPLNTFYQRPPPVLFHWRRRSHTVNRRVLSHSRRICLPETENVLKSATLSGSGRCFGDGAEKQRVQYPRRRSASRKDGYRRMCHLDTLRSALAAAVEGLWWEQRTWTIRFFRNFLSKRRKNMALKMLVHSPFRATSSCSKRFSDSFHKTSQPSLLLGLLSRTFRDADSWTSGRLISTSIPNLDRC